MKAIQVKYHGPTNTRGSRLTASDDDGNRITISYDSTYRMGMDAHSVAAVALCKKMGWTGSLVGGGLKDSYVFTFLPLRGDNYGIYKIK